MTSMGFTHLKTTDLNENQRANLHSLEEALYHHWDLGRNLVLNWCHRDTGLDLTVVPNYLTVTFLNKRQASLDRELSDSGKALRPDRLSEEFIKGLIAGTRQVDPARLTEIAHLLEVEPIHVPLPHPMGKDNLSRQIVDNLISRYSISFEEGRAVILFDIVEFSLFTPFEQITQLNSLAYSINSAHRRALQKNIDVDFAHTTTGDGFYIWNRESGIQANTNLYHFMHLALADNAIARLKSQAKTVPLLKAAFLVGSYYTMFVTEGLHPSFNNFIVGDATIELERLINTALPGQILVGDFEAQIPLTDGPDAELITIDSVGFIERLQEGLSTLRGLEFSEEKIESIKCYLTGEHIQNDRYSIKKRQIIDKHGLTRNVFNAKINIHLKKGEPIFLGLQERDLALH
jgi:hypothetical protein